jgi:diguanylate cyclase (GGDEF)-like protein
LQPWLVCWPGPAKDGSLLDVEINGHRVDLGSRSVLAYSTADITLRRKAEAQLLEKQQHLDHLAHHDQLTGLPNRLFLAAHLPGAIEQARSSGSLLAVLFLDLDRFKHINDSRGHETGDKLLKEVARRIRSTTREGDLVVRMGGDEFIVVLKTVRNTEQIQETAARINDALAAPVLVDDRPLVTTVSIGVSLYPRDGTDMGELLRHSDTAMYQAKDRGRNNFQLFSPAMDRRLKERMAIEAVLRAALQGEQLDSEELAGGFTEDRSALRARSGHRPQRSGDRQRHHRHGAASAHPSRGRGHRGLAAAGEIAATGVSAGAGLSVGQAHSRGAMPPLSAGQATGSDGARSCSGGARGQGWLTPTAYPRGNHSAI